MEYLEENHAGVSMKKKRHMRRGLIDNPMYYKSSHDGKIYVRTGKVNHWNFFKKVGQAFKAVGKGIGSAAKAVGKAAGKAGQFVVDRVGDIGNAAGDLAFGVLEPFRGMMKKQLVKRGITPPPKLRDIAKLFFNNVVAKKNFEGAVPYNFETFEDHLLPLAIIPPIIAFVKSLLDKSKKGEPLPADEQQIANDVLAVTNTLVKKAGNAGIAPDDLTKLVGNLPIPQAAKVIKNQRKKAVIQKEGEKKGEPLPSGEIDMKKWLTYGGLGFGAILLVALVTRKQ